jgi:hypothetical protein
MTVDEFKATTSAARPPTPEPLLQALWHDARGEWDEAHRLAQEVDDVDAAWVHAYLHRKEGDADNAAYWYGRAGQPVAHDALDVEWNRIATALLARVGIRVRD